jgi:hypothetical protein
VVTTKPQALTALSVVVVMLVLLLTGTWLLGIGVRLRVVGQTGPLVLLQQLLAAELLVALRLETYLQEHRHLFLLDGQIQQAGTGHQF